MVLIPGEDATLSWWSPSLLTALASSHRVTIFDLPGTGFSGPGAGASVASLAEATGGLIGALGLTHPELVGWGLGGEIALDLALMHAADAGSIVLADTCAGGALSAPLPPSAALLASPEATLTELSSVVFGSAQARARSSWLREMDLEPPDNMVASAVSAEAAVQQRFLATGIPVSALAKLRVRVLAIAGTADALFPPVDASAIVTAVRGAREMLIAGAGYGAILQLDPAHLSSLEQFLAG